MDNAEYVKIQRESWLMEMAARINDGSYEKHCGFPIMGSDDDYDNEDDLENEGE